ANALVEQRNFSATWAAREAGWLVSPLFTTEARSSSHRSLVQECSQIPLFIIEDETGRRRISPRELAKYSHVWTIESELIRSAERLIGEVPGTGGIRALSVALGGSAFELSELPILCGAADKRIGEAFLG